MLDLTTSLRNRRETPTSARPVGRMAMVGNFPPRRCGIATFTCDVYAALMAAYPNLECDVYAMTDDGSTYAYPDEVKFELRQNSLVDYAEAARRINASGAEVVNLQHEYGIFGGSAGDYLLTLLDGLRIPVVTSLHTVLTTPDADQRRVMNRIIERSSRIIVMTRKGREILREVYDAPAAKIAVVPHGVPDMPLEATDGFKPRFGLEGHDVLMTFGLLSPGKGIETMIRAMPQVIAARPNAVYLILGATHPHLVAREGERYRESLAELAQSLGVGEAVRFVNDYVDTPKLLEYLSAADIYVTPYPNVAQITSGTLSYAVSLGKPVISTPYWHAAELLADGRGVLTPFNDPGAMGEAAIALLTDADRQAAIRQKAYAAGREMIWSRLAEGFMGLFRAVRSDNLVGLHTASNMELPEPALGGVIRMSDPVGILQHGLISVPDRNHGYCVDDNARALMLMLRLERAGFEAPAALTTTYASFLHHAWNGDLGRFRNFMGYDRRWLEDVGSDDSFGRSFWAACYTAANALREDLRVWGLKLAQAAFPRTGDFPALRTNAFLILGLCELAKAQPGSPEILARLSDLAGRLEGALRAIRSPNWLWFEPFLCYDNARLPEALLRASAVLSDERMQRAGLDSLEWLCHMQIAPSGCFRPIGTGSFGVHYATPEPFDQQPLEAAATVEACEAAYAASRDPRWIEEARRAYAWYLGDNDLGVRMVQVEVGGCYDGLTPERANLNQGAESLLSFQSATCVMHGLIRSAGVQAPSAIRR
jgi:glycosyltransferase involved in cell wall biosynthesis